MAGIGEKAIVTIIRKWNNPTIHVWASDEEIGMQMDLIDFVKALAAEVGSPTMVLTKKQLLDKMLAGMIAIELEVKSKTLEIM